MNPFDELEAGDEQTEEPVVTGLEADALEGLEPEEEGEEDLYSDFDPEGEYDDDLDDWHYEPAGPSLVETTEPVDPSDYAAIIHDSFGEKYVNIATLMARSSSVTILRILGVLKLEPRGEVQYFLDGALVTADHVVQAGNAVYIVGKLAGGK